MTTRRPSTSLSEMEETLGHTATELSDSDDEEQRFYSDLSPVSKDRYKKTRRELDEYIKLTNKGAFSSTEEESFSGPGLVQVSNLASGSCTVCKLICSQKIASCRDSIVLERRSSVGLYSFTADIHYESGFDLPLQLTKLEALATMSVAKVCLMSCMSRLG